MVFIVMDTVPVLVTNPPPAAEILVADLTAEEAIQIFHTQEIVVAEAAEIAASAQAEHHIAAVLR